MCFWFPVSVIKKESLMPKKKQKQQATSVGDKLQARSEVRMRRELHRELHRELRKAAALDAGLEAVLTQVGYPEPRARAAELETLLRIIVSQQLSTQVAATIWGRLERVCGKPVTHRKILKRDEAELRGCGLSKQKTEYIRGLAEMVADKRLDLAAVAGMAEVDAEAAIAELVKARGLGRWSAQIYVMFALQHRDIFPEADLALQVAVQRYCGLAERPSAKETAEIARRWAPHRSSVAVLMWQYYGATTLD